MDKEKIKEMFNHLFCRHDWTITKWHWVNRYNSGFSYPKMRYEMVCKKCGKKVHEFAPRGSELERMIEDCVEQDEDWYLF